MVLTGDPRRGGRHSTLRSVLAWSEALLPAGLRDALADFSVLAGPVGPADLGAVVATDDPVSAVTALAARSLVDSTEEGRTPSSSLETVRQFGRERLGADGRVDLVGARHARWFTDAADELVAAYDSPAEADAIGRFDAIVDELREAHRWARSADPELARRLSEALFLPAYQTLQLEVFD